MEEGKASEHDPGKIAATGGGGRALARRDVGEGKEMRAGPGRQREKDGRGERTTEAEGIRASVLG